MERPDPAIIVIFGITGDLSKRYLLPALYHLFKDNALNPRTRIIGITRGETTSKDLFEQVELCVNEVDKICDPDALMAFQDHTSMLKMDLDDPEAYDELRNELDKIEEISGTCMNRLYYLSVPPLAYTSIIDLLGTAGLNASCKHGKAITRLMIEKPFGHDLNSACELITKTATVFGDDQLFLIDHYMAKEAVKPIIKYRLDNPEIDDIWNNQNITSVTISAKEKIGIEGRAAFYDNIGALRDFIQSHLIQLLGVIAMEQPDPLNSKTLHAAKESALDRIEDVQPVADASETAFGQYKGYLEEVESPDSKTETYAAITLFSNSTRWQGVPFKLITGKALNERRTEIKITFNSPAVSQNQELVFQIQPEPGRPRAYETVLLDAAHGDQTLFASTSEVLNSWRILQPLLDQWDAGYKKLVIYQPGSSEL